MADPSSPSLVATAGMSIKERLRAYSQAASSTDELAPKPRERRLSGGLENELPSVKALRGRVSSWAEDGGSPSSSAAPKPATNLRDQLARVERGDASLSSLDFSGNAQFLALSQAQKSQALGQLARGDKLQVLLLNKCELDSSNAPALALLLTSNRALSALSLEGNSLTEPGLLQLAAALRGHPALAEMSVANQARPVSTQAALALIEAMEGTESLVQLNLGALRDGSLVQRQQAAVMRNTERMRQRRRAVSTGDAPVEASKAPLRRAMSFERPPKKKAGEGAPAPKRQVSTALAQRMQRISKVVDKVIDTKVKVVDWEAEAARIAASEETECGAADDADVAADQASAYVLTGNAHWKRATEKERRAVVDAFATNRRVLAVQMSDAFVGEAMGEAWGAVLATNTTLLSLNLESNSLSSGAILALSDAIKANATLKELKLANQHVAFSQRAEEAFASALESNTTLVRLTIDLRSTRARDLIHKYLTRNQDKERAERRASGGGAAPPPRPGLGRSFSFDRPKARRADSAPVVPRSRPSGGGGAPVWPPPLRATPPPLGQTSSGSSTASASASPVEPPRRSPTFSAPPGFAPPPAAPGSEPVKVKGFFGGVMGVARRNSAAAEPEAAAPAAAPSPAASAAAAGRPQEAAPGELLHLGLARARSLGRKPRSAPRSPSKTSVAEAVTEAATPAPALAPAPAPSMAPMSALAPAVAAAAPAPAPSTAASAAAAGRPKLVRQESSGRRMRRNVVRTPPPEE